MNLVLKGLRNVYHLYSFENVIKNSLLSLTMKKTNAQESASLAKLKLRWSRIVEFNLLIGLLSLAGHFSEESFL